MEFIDLGAQYAAYKLEIDKALSTVFEHGKFIMGPEVGELETKLAEYAGVKHSITVASGTDSLEIALRALEIGAGDEVITVPFTWISTAEVISLVGAMPKFVDICPDTFNLDVTLLRSAITPATKAIIPVSLFGQVPDLESVNEIADEYGIPVIEDAAQSFGSTRNGKKSCSLSTISSTSFFPAKPLGCYGDGGALFTDNDEIAERMRCIRSHGGLERHHHTMVGMNGRFDTIQAAILLAKLHHYPDEVEARMRIGNRYSERLSDYATVPVVAEGNTHVYAQYTIRVANRDNMRKSLSKVGIPTGIYYPKCLHEQPVFEGAGYSVGDFPEAEKASKEVLSLPMGPFLKENDQDLVIQEVGEAISGKKSTI
jgi:UDP-2-acetamido-2-deoxy-ribo-hexuluronate aminotransferase